MHISTNDLHCCKPARLLQLAPSGGCPRRRPPDTAPTRIAPLTNDDVLQWKTDGRQPANGPPTATPQQRRHSPSTPARGPPKPPSPRLSPLPPPPPSQSQGQIPITITEQNFLTEARPCENLVPAILAVKNEHRYSDFTRSLYARIFLYCDESVRVVSDTEIQCQRLTKIV
jgi:hypothetical protein